MSTPDFIIFPVNDTTGKVYVNSMAAARFIKYDWGDAGPLESIHLCSFTCQEKYIDDLKHEAAHLVIEDRR